MTTYQVRKQEGSKRFGIYLGSVLVEGGFFYRSSANAVCAIYRSEAAEQARRAEAAKERA